MTERLVAQQEGRKRAMAKGVVMGLHQFEHRVVVSLPSSATR